MNILAPEELALVQMGKENEPILLTKGDNTVVVGVGVFKVFSTTDVNVVADNDDVVVTATASDKDGNWPDPRKLRTTCDHETLRQFFAAKTQAAPH